MDNKTEILYLARGGKGDIYAEKCPREQHIVDGIRFLYRHYVKKKPGVILNDANSHSRRTQTVLFVSAVRPVLERPVLILCSEGDEAKWGEYFKTWTNMANDITTDTTNPFAKKVSVYISPIHDVTKYCSREWSGVIIDSDIIHKEVLKININAKFKVWIIGVDVKKDLTIFPQLYKWLYQKEKFDPNMFRCDKRDPIDVVDKAILLDTFMEDVVFNSDDFENTVPKSPEIPKVTRKNKDATGTKIKRTKRKNIISSSEDDSPTKTSKTNKTASNDNNNFKSNSSKAEISKIYSRAATDNSKSTIDCTRPSNNSRATVDDFRVAVDDSRPNIDRSRATVDDTRVILDVLSNRTVDSSKIRIEYYEEDQNNDQRDEINEITEKSPIICDEEDNSMDLLLKYEVDEKYTPVFKKNNEDQKLEPDKSYFERQESNDSIYGKDTQENFDELVKLKDVESCHSNIKDGTTSSNKNNIHLVSNEITEITSIDQIIINTNKIEDEIDVKSKEVKESEDIFSTESMKTLNKITKQNEPSKQQITLNVNKKEIDKPKELRKQSEDLFSTESISTLNKVSNQNVEDNVAKKTDPNSSFDAKIKQMEEIAMKKFKGSLLDSLF